MTNKEAKEMATTIAAILSVDLDKGIIKMKDDSVSVQNVSEIFLVASDYKTGAYTSYHDADGKKFYEIDIKIR